MAIRHVVTVLFTAAFILPAACNDANKARECAEKCARDTQECREKKDKECDARGKACAEGCEKHPDEARF